MKRYRMMAQAHRPFTEAYAAEAEDIAGEQQEDSEGSIGIVRWN